MKKSIKLILTILITLFILLITNNYVQAATTDFSPTTTTVEVGDTITVTATVTAAQWDLSIKVNGDSIATLTELDNYKSNITKSFSGTYKATEKGEVIFSLEGDITDFDQTNTTVNKTTSVTVKEKSSSSSASDSSSGGNVTNTEDIPTFTSVNQTVYCIDDDINVRASYSTSSPVLGQLNRGDNVTRTGTATVNGRGWSKITFNGKTAYVVSEFLSTTKPVEEKKSSNNKLKSLTVVPEGLTPNFDKETNNYKLTVGSDIDKLKIEAVTDHKNATVSISGNNDFKLGENVVSIKVTAEDKSVRTYKITVTKEKKAQLGLKKLQIEGVTLTPEFDETTYQYKVDLNNNDISELDIEATSTIKDATVEIVGNTNLKAGENIITILVRNMDGGEEEVVTYQVTVNIPKPVILENSTNAIINNNLYKYIAVGAIIFIIIVIIIIIIAKERKNDDMETYYGGYNIDNNEEKVETAYLSDDELPNSLKKNKKEVTEIEETQLDNEVKSKIDVLTSNNDEFEDMTSKRKRGKHF